VTSHVCITERKLIENQLVEAERLAAIGETMQGLSHEARNALQRSQSHIDLLKAKIESDHEALRLVERIELAQRELLGLYEEAISYAAPITLNRESCGPPELANEVRSRHRSISQQLEFHVSNEALRLTCNVDVHAIHQVFDVLIDNALASGASTIEISFVPDELNGRPAITVIVSDNGPGIPNADREKVFEPFYTTRTRGTGLGLATSRRIVSAHGGVICLGAPCRGGASVYMTLPATRTGIGRRSPGRRSNWIEHG
jgi:signal transduction histidine kinase